MGAKGWVDEGKAVAGDGFSRAEGGLTGLMVVSESATKVWSLSRGVDGEFGDGTRVPPRWHGSRFGRGTTYRDVKMQDKRARMLGNRGLPVWGSIDSPVH